MATDRPTRFGDYTLLRRVATGGMAEIFRAQIRGPAGFRRDVAIKTVHAQHNEDREFIQMLLDEARIAARLVHPHIAQILNCGSIDGVFYIAMEYVDGQPLNRVLQRLAQRGERLSLQECLYIGIGLLRALGYAHKQVDDRGASMGIVHRDVSPQNVMVSYGGGIKLVDFGVARAVGKLHKTETGIVQGKVAYMAPEHLDGQPVDHRSDQYAAALVILELIGNQRAYLAETSSELVKKVLMGEVRNIDEMLEGVPAKGRLVPVLRRALCVDREGRFPSCEVMAAELVLVLNEVDPSFQEEALGNRVRDLFAQEVEQEQAELRAVEAQLEAQPDDLEPASFSSPHTVPTIALSTKDEVVPGRTGRVLWIVLAAVLLVGGSVAAYAMLGRQTGSLRITTTPPGATVSIDGSDAPSVTPTAMTDLEVGSDVEMTLTLEGYAPLKRSYRVGKGNQEIHYELRSVLATLEVIGAAPDVEVLVAGESVGTTDASGRLEARVAAGPDVPVRVQRRNGSMFATALALSGGQRARVEVTPSPTAFPAKRKGRKPRDPTPKRGQGSLDVVCLPWCKIHIDGKEIGKNSPLRDHPLRAGEHVVEVINPPSGRRDKKTVVIEAGGQESLRFRLE